MTTNQFTVRKIRANELNAKLGHPEEDRIRKTANRLHYRVNGVIDFCEDHVTEKSKHKLVHKVVDKRNLQPGEMIYLDISS